MIMLALIKTKNLSLGFEFQNINQLDLNLAYFLFLSQYFLCFSSFRIILSFQQLSQRLPKVNLF